MPRYRYCQAFFASRQSFACGATPLPYPYLPLLDGHQPPRYSCNRIVSAVRTAALLYLIGNLSGAPLVFRNIAPNVRYLGSDACANCHRTISEKYRRTAMGRSITAPTLDLLPRAVQVRSEKLQREFRVFSNGGQLYQAESERRDGVIVFEAVHKLEYAIGAGENGISFAVRRGKHLFQQRPSPSTPRLDNGICPPASKTLPRDSAGRFTRAASSATPAGLRRSRTGKGYTAIRLSPRPPSAARTVTARVNSTSRRNLVGCAPFPTPRS